jgi:hypothetical protein
MNASVNHRMPVALMTDVGFGGLPQPRYSYGAAWMPGVPPPPPPPAAGAFHFWLAPPVQVHSCNGVPSAELTPVTSRHLLAWGFTRSRLEV